MPPVHYTARARRDLLDIWVAIALDNPGAADRVYDRLAERVEILERFPQAGPARPEIADAARAGRASMQIAWSIQLCAVT